MDEKIFVQPMFIEPCAIEKMPWLKAKIDIHSADMIAFIQQHTNERGYVKIDIKESKNGKWYGQLNTFQRPKVDRPEALNEEIDASSIPF